MCHSIVKMTETTASVLLSVAVMRHKVKKKTKKINASNGWRERGVEVRIERMKEHWRRKDEEGDENRWKANLNLFVVKHYALKEYRWLEAQLHGLLTSELRSWRWVVEVTLRTKKKPQRKNCRFHSCKWFGRLQSRPQRHGKSLCPFFE